MVRQTESYIFWYRVWLARAHNRRPARAGKGSTLTSGRRYRTIHPGRSLLWLRAKDSILVTLALLLRPSRLGLARAWPLVR